MLDAADQGFVSVERIVASGELVEAAGDITRCRVSRLFVDGMVEAPRDGAHPTSCDPEYARDEQFQSMYAKAQGAEGWEAFRSQWLAFDDEASYQAALAARRADGGAS